MSQLNGFDGGLNTRLAPHLININEAQEYINIDNTSTSLKPLKEDTNLGVEALPYLYNFKDSWVSSSNYRTYQEYQDKLCYSDGVGIPQKSSDGINFQNLGIQKPLVTPISTINGVGVLEGTIQYCYTYYNNSDGTESAPSSYSLSLAVDLNSVDINVTASTDNQVDIIRLYRLGGNLNIMTLVEELPNTTATYTDNLGNLELLGSVLDSEFNQQAPEGLKYLTSANSMMFGSIGDKLYYSDVAFINYWSSFNAIDFDYEITGIGIVPNGILVFTKYQTYIITGTSPGTLSKYLLNNNQGCIRHETISFAYNTLVWLSSDGVCVSTGGDIVVVSREKLGKLSIANPKDSVVYDDVYYISYDDKVLAVDFRFGTIFRYIDIIANGLHVYNDLLYYSKDDLLHSFATSVNDRSITYLSPKLSDGQVSNLKTYKKFYIKVIGDLNIEIFIDGTSVADLPINSLTNEISVPQLTRHGYYIEFKITGTGELLELQYIVEGRQNGR